MLWRIVAFSLKRARRNFVSASAAVAGSYAVMIPNEYLDRASEAFVKGGSKEA